MKPKDSLTDAIRTRNFRAFRAIFPTTEALIRAYRHAGQDSLLTMMIKHGDAAFLNKVLYGYFSKNNLLGMLQKRTFLNGTDADGNRMNYHYFKNFLPNKGVEAAFGMKNNGAQLKNPSQSIRMEKLYSVIKNHCIALEKNLAKLRPAETECPMIVLRDVLSDYTVYFMAPKQDNSSKKPLLQQIYDTLDYPDEFVEQAKAIRTIEPEWKRMRREEYLRPLTDAFMKENGIIRFEDRIDTDVETNLVSGKTYQMYASQTLDGKNSLIVVNSGISINKTTITHELTHRADKTGKEHMSTNPLMTYVVMLLLIDPSPNFDRKVILDKITQYYTPKHYNSEAIANIIQHAQFKREGYGKDHLLRNMYKLFGLFTRAKNLDDTAVLSRIGTMQNRLRNRPAMDLLCKGAADYFEAKDEARHHPTANSGAKDAAWQRLSALTAKINYEKIERELTADIIGEIRKINQINRDSEARKINIPNKLRQIETDTAPEVIFAHAARDFRTDKGDHWEYLNRLYAELWAEDGKRFNEKYLYAVAYSNALTKDKTFDRLHPKNFQNKTNLLERMHRQLFDFEEADIPRTQRMTPTRGQKFIAKKIQSDIVTLNNKGLGI